MSMRTKAALPLSHILNQIICATYDSVPFDPRSDSVPIIHAPKGGTGGGRPSKLAALSAPIMH